jgi:hypothetical protein
VGVSIILNFFVVGGKVYDVHYKQKNGELKLSVTIIKDLKTATNADFKLFLFCTYCFEKCPYFLHSRYKAKCTDNPHKTVLFSRLSFPKFPHRGVTFGTKVAQLNNHTALLVEAFFMSERR